ncbi:MAG: rhodanese-like domain-containing protein [Butyrivibrio sp.]|nr:rhodanese-like domain-containing protein [Butyrivibrio sp.]
MDKLRIFSKTEMTKKEASKEAYEYVKNSLMEEDEQNYIRASVLKDLFDCGACVMNVAQVFLKGIILPKTDREFGMNEELTVADLLEIEDRIFHREKRIVPENAKGNCEAACRIAADEYKGNLIVDVRDEESFLQGHLQGAINIPLEKIRINPHIIGNDKYEPVLFVCARGIKSSIAAEYAIRAGYMNVFYGSI